MATSRTLNSILFATEHVKNHPDCCRFWTCKMWFRQESEPLPEPWVRAVSLSTWRRTKMFNVSHWLFLNLYLRDQLCSHLKAHYMQSWAPDSALPWLPVSLWGPPSGKVGCWLHNPLAENISSTFPRPAVLSLLTTTLSFLHPLPRQLKWTRVRSQGEGRREERSSIGLPPLLFLPLAPDSKNIISIFQLPE